MGGSQKIGAVFTFFCALFFLLFFFPRSIYAVDGEITYTGTNTNLVGDDTYAGPFNLGFTFNYYGVNYTQAYININGTVNFPAGDSSYTNGTLNNSGANASIFAFWDDLITDPSPYDQKPIYYATIGSAPNRKFIAQWTNVYFYGTAIQMGTFQVILYEGTNNIQIQYRDLLGGNRALGDSATIGIKKDNSTYKQYSASTASLTQGQSILYSPNGVNDFTVTSLTPQAGSEVSSGYDLLYLAPDGAPTSPTLVNPPNTTTGVTTTPTFEWLPVDTATSYTVLVSLVANFSSTVVNASGQTGTSYTLGSPLNNVTTYYWRVQSVNSKGSSLSSTRSFTTGAANAAPDTTANVQSLTLIGGSSLTSVAGSTLSATLSDPDVNEQVRYRIQIATDNAFNNLNIDYRSPFGEEGPVTYTYGENGGIYLVGTHSSVLPVGSYYLRIRAEDDAAASSSWYTVSGIAFHIVADTFPPVISSVSSTPNSTTASIRWTTNETASSQVQYGLNTQYGFASSEIDTSTRVTSHEISLTNLKSCARYYYQVISTDGSTNRQASSQYTFNTSGCPTSSINGGTDSPVATSGGTFHFTNNQSTAGLSVPSNFATDSATFQINKLDPANLPEGPSGQTLAHNNIYDLIAVTTEDQQLTSFNTPITFTVSYGADTETDFQEDTLDVYRFNGSGWDKKNCTLDMATNTLTCLLSGFSVYGVFGSSKVSDGSTNNTSNNSNSPPSNSSGTSSCQMDKPSSIPDLFQINVTDTTADLFFTPISNTNRFYVSYSTSEIAEEYGAEITLGKDGVQNFLVELLHPNTIYYFKVRGQNGCTPGDWSETMKVKTSMQENTIKNIYYKNTPFVDVQAASFTKTNTQVLGVSDIKPKSIPSSIVNRQSAQKVESTSLNTRRCFLLWCW